MVHAYYMDSSEDDCRLPHSLSPVQPCTLAHLAQLGVAYWHMPAAAEKCVRRARAEHAALKAATYAELSSA